MTFTTNSILPILQISIAPTVLISGVGLLILSLNTRSSLIFDRIRNLIDEYTKTKETYIKHEIDWLYRRVKVLRISLYGFVLSVMFNVLTILSIFIIELFGIQGALIVPILFACGVICVIVGVIAFLHDLNLNLIALKIELKNNMK